MAPRNTRPFTFAFDGGLDITTSPLMLRPGRLLWCKNFEIANTGGYRRIFGYEPVDGQPLASTATYLLIEFVDGSGFLAGDVVTGLTSGATAYVLEDSGDPAGRLVLYPMTGTFEDGEYLQVGGVTKGTVDVIYDLGTGFPAFEEHRAKRTLAIAHAMAQVQQVPGDGPILGVWYYKDHIYAFRDNIGRTECNMWESSPTGWVAVATPTLAPGGRYDFVNYNFTGHAGTLKMYGCDGKNKAFQFDGTTFTQLTTGMTSDTPILISAHRNHLFLVFSGGSVQHSGLADPTTWTAVLGAAELAIGDEATGLLPGAGGTLFLFSRNTIQVLYGSSSADWEIRPLSANSGAIRGSAQLTFAPVFVSDYGLVAINQADAFGDFQANTLSLPVQKIIDNYRTLIVGSVVLRTKNQYRLFFANGEVLTMTFSGDRVRGFTVSDYGRVIRCVSGTGRSDSEDETENDIFFGSDDGYVYKMDSGNSFAGADIQALLKIAPMAVGYPRSKKFFRLLILEVETETGSPVTLLFKPDFSLLNSEAHEPTQETITTQVQGGDWDEAYWDEFFWSSEESGTNFYEIRPEGVGLTLGGIIYSESNNQEPFTVRTGTLHYSMRGLQR